jgi:hypothetical protein
VIYYGSTAPAMHEALDVLEARGQALDALRVRAFPFSDEVMDFIANQLAPSDLATVMYPLTPVDAAVLTRSVPVSKAFDDALIAYGQNGEAIRPEQGYPARLFLPGWEGNASVKWLRRIELSDRPFMTREETSKYTDPMADGTARIFSFLMDARSLITYPAYPVTVSRGWIEINGIAWTGSGKIRRVDVSTDGGGTWTDISGTLPQAPARALAVHPRKNDFIYLGTEVGVFASENAGMAWSPTNEGPTNCSVDGFHSNFRPNRRAMMPKWHTLTERWPISASQIGCPRDRAQSKKFRMWFSLTYSRFALAGRGVVSNSGSLASIRPRVTKIQPSVPSNFTPCCWPFLSMTAPFHALAAVLLHISFTPSAYS